VRVPEFPRSYVHVDAVGVSTDSLGNVYVLANVWVPVPDHELPCILVYDRGGTFLRSWGAGVLTAFAHGLTVAPDDTLYCVDDGNHCVYQFSSIGELLLTIGAPGVPSNPDYDHTIDIKRLEHATAITPSTIKSDGSPPFTHPTNLAVAPNGDLYVADGRGNCRVHRFSPAGELIQSWGRRGIGPGEFNHVHGIIVDGSGNVLVADRDNDRIQFFTSDGEFLTEWTHVQRPSNIIIDPADRFVIAEATWFAGKHSMRLGEITRTKLGRISILDADGTVLARSAAVEATGLSFGPHDLALDPFGILYVAAVTHTPVGDGHERSPSAEFSTFARRVF
jgi:DNA-binding beta-propeller fold protein YncE